MLVEDILPITSISLTILGVIIISIGLILLASTIANKKISSNSTEAEDIIGEINHMFTYFTDRIQQEESHPIENENIDKGLKASQNQHYDQVIKYKQEGKTPEQIAKKLNIGKGEVNLILGIAQMR